MLWLSIVVHVAMGKMLTCIALQGRELVAGSEGFLTGKQWRGLYRQEVVWGEMVSSSSQCFNGQLLT